MSSCATTQISRGNSIESCRGRVSVERKVKIVNLKLEPLKLGAAWYSTVDGRSFLCIPASLASPECSRVFFAHLPTAIALWHLVFFGIAINS
jgi:hypothetical protein